MTRNLTLAIEDELLAKFRVLAAQQRTTVNALIRKHMEEATGVAERRRAAIDRMVALSEASMSDDRAQAGRGDPVEDWRFSRDDTYSGARFDWPRNR